MSLLIPYRKLPDHDDPLFEELTYGNRRRDGRKLKELQPGDYVFFHTTIARKKYITAYFVVRQVMETEKVVENPELRRKYKSPHVARWLEGKREEDDVLVFGDPLLSMVLDEPLPFDRKLAAMLSLNIQFPPGRLESQAIGSATRAWRPLEVGDVRILLDAIKEVSEGNGHRLVEKAIGEAAQQERERSQGLAVSPAVRKAVEDLAMKRATSLFAAQGYAVEDVSRHESYDLRCKRNDEVLYVEVKGTQTSGDSILLTPGEVQLVRRLSPDTALFVLHSVAVVETDGKARASGGQVRVIQPWSPDGSRLKPLGYSYQLPKE